MCIRDRKQAVDPVSFGDGEVLDALHALSSDIALPEQFAYFSLPVLLGVP